MTRKTPGIVASAAMIALTLLTGCSGGIDSSQSSGHIMYTEYIYQYRYIGYEAPMALLCWYTGTTLGSRDDDPWDTSLWYCNVTIDEQERYLKQATVAREQAEYGAPLYAMSYIYGIYSDWQRSNTRIYLVSSPATQEELIFSEERAREHMETYIFLYETMGLEIPDYLL